MQHVCEGPRYNVTTMLILTIDNTNSKHLELFTVLGEYDNAGFPISYCLILTVNASDAGKKMKALIAWESVLCSKYGIIPQFIHVNKVEIGSCHKTLQKYSCVGGICIRQ